MSSKIVQDFQEEIVHAVSALHVSQVLQAATGHTHGFQHSIEQHNVNSRCADESGTAIGPSTFHQHIGATGHPPLPSIACSLKLMMSTSQHCCNALYNTLSWKGLRCTKGILGWHSSPRYLLCSPGDPGNHRADSEAPCDWHAHTRPSRPSPRLQRHRYMSAARPTQLGKHLN